MSESKNRKGRWVAAVLAMLCLLGIAGMAIRDSLGKGEVVTVDGYREWGSAEEQCFESLPVMDGGRVKPVSSLAAFVMLELHGAREMKVIGDGGKMIKISPTEWMMDVLFRPDLAVKQPTFRVDNSEVLTGLGMAVKGKRDRYSYQELLPVRDRLDQVVEGILKVEDKQRSPLQKQTMALAEKIQKYENYLGYFKFAREGLKLQAIEEASVKSQRTDMGSFMAATMDPTIRQQLDMARKGQATLDGRLEAILRQVIEYANFSREGFAMLPPVNAQERAWKNAGAVMMEVVGGEQRAWKESVLDIEKLQEVVRLADGEHPQAFQMSLEQLKERMAVRMAQRGEGQRVAVEVRYNQKNYFLSAMVYYLLAMVSGFIMWMAGKSRVGTIATWGVWGLLACGFASSVMAISMRCWIMQRPPIGNLYDTIIFIATAVVGFVMVLEALVRKRIVIGFGPILGAALIVLARRFELGDAKDHMDPLVAVLDSNYWLTTHVITITLGYAAGLLSAYLSVGYVWVAALGLDGPQREIRKLLTRLVYGMVCFTVLLSLIGTVLGGIWANDSWGRFWGWDPKENGALLIVLWTLAILHARIGGYLREWGLHLASIFTAVVIAFSWWHVNFLEVGLHNYGFTSGKTTIWVFYGVQVCILALGFWVRAREMQKKSC